MVALGAAHRTEGNRVPRAPRAGIRDLVQEVGKRGKPGGEEEVAGLQDPAEVLCLCPLLIFLWGRFVCFLLLSKTLFLSIFLF